MKPFFQKYKTLLLVSITALLFAVAGMKQCSSHRAEVQALKAAHQAREQHIRNEVQTYYLERETAKLDSLKATEAAKTFKAKTDAIIYKTEADRLKKASADLENKYNLLVSENAPCPDLLEASLERIDTLKRENLTLEKECESLGIEAEGYSRQLYLCEQQRSIADTLLKSAKLEIKAETLLADKYKKQVKAEQAKQRFTKFVAGVVVVAETLVILIKNI